MASAETVKSLAPYAERVLDDYIYDQADHAQQRLGVAYGLITRRGAKDAARNERLRKELVEAAQAVRNAALAATGRKTKPRRRRIARPLVILALAGGAAAILIRRRSGGERTEHEEHARAHGDGRVPASAAAEAASA